MKTNKQRNALNTGIDISVAVRRAFALYKARDADTEIRNRLAAVAGELRWEAMSRDSADGNLLRLAQNLDAYATAKGRS